MATASATPSTSNARSGVDSNELLDLRDPECGDQESTQAGHGSGSDAATTANEPTQGSSGDGPSGAGLSEALKAERRRKIGRAHV